MPTDSSEMACKELVEVITDYLEGALPPQEMARFEAHLAVCRSCQTYLEQMRHVISTLGKLSPESIPPEGKEELLEVFRAWKKARRNSLNDSH